LSSQISEEFAMADQREQRGPEPFSNHQADNTAGREANAATPLDKEQPTEAAPERYPSVRQDDSIETPGEGRSFDPSVSAPTPRQGAGDDAQAAGEGRLGPEGDPAEGKRD